MNLLSSTSIFSFYTLISRVLGYLRDILIAVFLGASIFADAFLLHLDYQILLDDFLPKVPLMQLLYPVILRQKLRIKIKVNLLQMKYLVFFY